MDSSFTGVVSTLWDSDNDSECTPMTSLLSMLYYPQNYCGWIHSSSSPFEVMPYPIFLNIQKIITSFYRTDSQSLTTMCVKRILWFESDIFTSSQTSIFLLSHKYSPRCFQVLLLSLRQVHHQVGQLHLCSQKGSTKGVNYQPTWMHTCNLQAFVRTDDR